jgi:hypothetical protein
MSGATSNTVDSYSMLIRGEKGDKQRILCDVLDLGLGKTTSAEVYVDVESGCLELVFPVAVGESVSGVKDVNHRLADLESFTPSADGKEMTFAFVKDQGVKELVHLKFALGDRMLVVQNLLDDYTQKCIADDLLNVQTQIFTSHNQDVPEEVDYVAAPLSPIREAPSLNFAALQVRSGRKGGALEDAPPPTAVSQMSNGDGDADEEEVIPNCVNGQIHPQAAWRVWWDTVLTLFILYSVLSVPYRIGFDDDAVDGWLVFDYTVDIFFGVDIVIAFFTAYVDENEVLVTEWKTIVSKYLRGWFLVDLFSTLPFGLIMDSIGTGAGDLAKYPKLLRMLRLVRLLKLVRLIKLSKFFKRWEQEGVVNPSILLLVKLLVGVLFLSHFFACTWMFIARESDMGSRWFVIHVVSACCSCSCCFRMLSLLSAVF